jgi:hypothetical protein
MKALAKLLKCTGIVLVCVFCTNAVGVQSNGKKIEIFQKYPTPIVSNSKEDYESPYKSVKLDYHDFKMQEENTFAATTTKRDWYLKYKKMFNFKCKEPFWGAGLRYTKKDYRKTGYTFRLVDNQVIEDSISFLISKYYYNNIDTLKRWNLPPSNDNRIVEKIIKRLETKHFKIIATVFDIKKYRTFIEVPEAEQTNDEMVYMPVFKYPADVDIFIFNFEINNWEYVESITVSGDHELELYVLQKFEPRYLKDCELKDEVKDK